MNKVPGRDATHILSLLLTIYTTHSRVREVQNRRVEPLIEIGKSWQCRLSPASIRECFDLARSRPSSGRSPWVLSTRPRHSVVMEDPIWHDDGPEVSEIRYPQLVGVRIRHLRIRHR